MVDGTCGVKFDVTSPARAYAEWSAAIVALASAPEALLALSMGATERAKSFLWSENHRQINTIYSQLAGAREPLLDGRLELSMVAAEVQLR